MQDLSRVAATDMEPDPEHPRIRFDDAEDAALGQNMLILGQHVPVILFLKDGKKGILDGVRRWRGALAAGIPDLFAIVLPEKPDERKLRLLQMCIDVHKIPHSLWERSCTLRDIRECNGWSIVDLSANVHLRQPIVSKLLSFQRLDKPIQQMVHAGVLGLEKAYIISQEPNFERQREMVKLYAQLPREQFRQKAKHANAAQQVTVKRARFYLPGGASVVVHGASLTLAEAIACLLETVKQLKRGQAQNKDIAEAQKEMRGKARAHHVAVE